MEAKEDLAHIHGDLSSAEGAGSQDIKRARNTYLAVRGHRDKPRATVGTFHSDCSLSCSLLRPELAVSGRVQSRWV